MKEIYNPLMPKEYPKVAHVESPSRVIINKGKDDDIQIGQTFLIYAVGDEIIDPETGKSLGKLEVVKGRGKVNYLQAKMAHVISIETKTNRIRRVSAFSMLIEGLHDTVEDVPFNNVAVGDSCRPI